MPPWMERIKMSAFSINLWGEFSLTSLTQSVRIPRLTVNSLDAMSECDCTLVWLLVGMRTDYHNRKLPLCWKRLLRCFVFEKKSVMQPLIGFSEISRKRPELPVRKNHTFNVLVWVAKKHFWFLVPTGLIDHVCPSLVAHDRSVRSQNVFTQRIRD